MPHLGNTRITFTTQEQIDEYTATMEAIHAEDETADFPNYNAVTFSSVSMYNHTSEAGATNSVVLNGAANKQVGLAKSLHVVPGDVIDISAYGKYFKPGSSQETVGALIANAMTAAFGLSPSGTPLEASHYQAINVLFDEGWLIGSDEWEDDDAPKAYLNYILFDEDMVPYDFGFDQIDASADVAQSGQHDQMILEVNVRKAGYAYIYISNEDDEIVEVYFDDLLISHQHSDVIQQDDYYPFGLTFNSYSRETSVPQDLKFNGKEAQNELGLEWLDYGARMYMSEIGRWGVKDAQGEEYQNLSLYHYTANNPIAYVDPDGNSHFYGGNGSYLGEGGDRSKDDVYYSKTTGEKTTVVINGVECEADVATFEKVKDNEGKDVDHQTFNNFAAAVYGESSRLDVQESMGIASAIVNYSNQSKGKYKLQELLSRKNGHIKAVGDNQYTIFLAGKGPKQDRNQVFYSVINALTGGHDFSNGATHWDGSDLGRNRTTHYRSSSTGYEISDSEHSTRYECNTGYCLNQWMGKNPVYISTAAYGQTIFWKSHPNNKKNTIYHQWKD